ncbi:type IV secretory system conjugative DNA transfer family protein [Pseudaestuariivita rosea]|uniref:type IV secretory system conjugative DNA transfer family protein n=1 Tax=Pseudaestuariivita rosea TaxID=2763263 RepID=UPI001ABB27D1|nr:type IV secretory system conjugative DNA transfer family protein [Pseudaestuariivita rosea]
MAQGFRRYVGYSFAALLFILALVSGPFLAWSAAILFALGGFFFGIGFWTAGKSTPTTFGSSRWATHKDVEENNVYGNDGIRLGHFFDGKEHQQISYKGDRHLLTVAPTRSGKGTTQIIPNLLTYEGSMLVIDPKGENALITAKHRKDSGHVVHIVDPWGIANVEGVSSSKFNPLDWLDITDVDIAENAMLLADALVVESNNDKAFFIEEAKALLQGLIMYVATADEEEGRRTLKRVRQHLVSSSEDQIKLFQNMANSAHHIIASTGHRCLQKDPELLSNVLASTQAQTHFLDSKRIQKNTERSDFKFEHLKTKSMTVYLVLPSDRLNAFGRWMRLLVQQAITMNARNIAEKPEKPILFVLDEFAALGRLTMIEQAYGLMAGFGMQLWGIVQDFNQLERIYDKGWQSFVANAGMINYFGSSDKQTAEYFSSLCGETTVWNVSTALARSFGRNAGQGGLSTNSSENTTDTASAGQRKLAYPDELMRMNAQKQLVFIENMHPIMATKQPWFENPKLEPLGVNLYAEQ